MMRSLSSVQPGAVHPVQPLDSRHRKRRVRSRHREGGGSLQREFEAGEEQGEERRRRTAFEAVLVRATIGTMRRAMATAARPTTMTTPEPSEPGSRPDPVAADVTRGAGGRASRRGRSPRAGSRTPSRPGATTTRTPRLCLQHRPATPKTFRGPRRSARTSGRIRADELFLTRAAAQCDRHSARREGFSRQALQESGVVTARCPGCQVQHLVADRSGWFGEPRERGWTS